MHGCGATMEIYRGHDAGAALSQLCLPAEKCCGMPYCEEFAVHSTQVEQGKQAKQASRLPRRTDCPSKCRTIPACDVCPDNLAVLCCRSLAASQQQTDTPWTGTAQTNGLSEQMQDNPRGIVLSQCTCISAANEHFLDTIQLFSSEVLPVSDETNSINSAVEHHVPTSTACPAVLPCITLFFCEAKANVVPTLSFKYADLVR